MTQALRGMRVAVLVAGGFDEADMGTVQRALTGAGAVPRIISTDQGLVSGWDGRGWGHNYAVDAPLNEALGVDYAALAIPGGRRSIDKLGLTGHTKRFIGSFIAAVKPVAVMGDALSLLAEADMLAGRHVAGPEDVRAEAERAGAVWSADGTVLDANLLSGEQRSATEDGPAYAAVMVDHFGRFLQVERAA